MLFIIKYFYLFAVIFYFFKLVDVINIIYINVISGLLDNINRCNNSGDIKKASIKETEAFFWLLSMK
ncbi:hypothetical protein C9J40_11365 [Photobacterium sp. GB-72]|nr:hypothetical protein C9J40_11365 [Photobacterium sp. GB-72]